MIVEVMYVHELYCNQWQQDVFDKRNFHTYVNCRNVDDYVMPFSSRAQMS